MKRIYAILILATFVVGLAPLALRAADPAVLQNQIDKTRQDRQLLLDEQARLQAELDAVNRQSTTLGTAVKSLDATKKRLANDIALTQSKVRSASLNIQSLENSIAQKQDQISVHHEAIGSLVQQLADYDSHSLVTDVLTYKELSDVWRDQGILTDLNDKLTAEITRLRADNQALAAEKVEKEKTKVQQIQLASELTGQKKVVEDNQTAKAKLLAETKNKEAIYQQMLADNIARQKQSEADLFRLESELQITLDPSLIPTARHSVLSWPLDKVTVTQQFGKTVGGQRLYASGFHNGIDFRAAMGTPVKAVLSGVVEGQGNTDSQRGCYSYGRWILIKHGNGLSTIYGHLSGTVVQIGQTVSTGQLIGYSGGTPGVYGSGYSTGPHLHVGLFASQGVEIKQFTTSNNCKQVFLPMADIRAYLDPLAYMPGY
jgi:murein DD-endopeptidase MepM/ murein hydrolase activator NlpD